MPCAKSSLPAARKRTKPRRIGVIGFEGANAVDITGPVEAFANVEPTSAVRHALPYEILLLGLTGDAFTAESGVRFVPHCRLEDCPPLDTLIVPGGWGLRVPATNEAVKSWLLKATAGIRRIASVCTGIYALAPTGFLDGRRVTTHWRFAHDVARRFPQLRVDGNALFIKDGRYYTSGGITAGIDLALALIEEDLGARPALAAARELVVYLKRAGGQEQFSEPLRFQTRSLDAFADLVPWVCAHLTHELSADILAARVSLSTRHFGRRFREVFECTPAEFVETTRLSEARDRLTESSSSIAVIGASVGFKSADVFRRRFEHRFGIAPGSYRERFSPRTPA